MSTVGQHHAAVTHMLAHHAPLSSDCRGRYALHTPSSAVICHSVSKQGDSQASEASQASQYEFTRVTSPVWGANFKVQIRQ
jgi:hypothetical protein